MSGRSPIAPLLWIFAVSLFVGTVLALGLGFDLFVQPPDVPEATLFPDRLQATQPFFAARWPYDAASTLLFVVGFGALALAAGGIASLGGGHRLADVFRASMLVSGILGVVAGLAYFGATKITIDLAYCDCGYIDTELIGQFWGLAIVHSATDWLSNGAVVFGAVAAALSTAVLRGIGLPSWWTGIAWAAAGLLIASIVLNELTDTPAGDIAVALATAILLPTWAIMLTRVPASTVSTGGEA
jgi:hypothetical protein